MRLSGVLSDRVRIVRQAARGPRVEGRSRLVEQDGPWLPARLTPSEAREVEDPQGGRRAVVMTGELLLGPEGVEVRSSDRLLMRSVRLGEDDALWNVTGLPEVLRGRRQVLAVRVSVERLREPVREVTP